MLTFRIDDVSVNTDHMKVCEMAAALRTSFPGCRVLLGISPLVQDMSAHGGLAKERVFPKEFNAPSDHRIFFQAQRCGLPKLEEYRRRIPGVEFAGHGLVHVDHRLLERETQELSILASCGLVGSMCFVPPFNKWNKVTESICAEYGITLVKWEDGWTHLVYHQLAGRREDQVNWYFHSHDFTLRDFIARLPSPA